MKNPILSFDQTLEHLEKLIPAGESGKSHVMALVRWLKDFDRTLAGESRFFPFIRENKNIGFVLDRNGNREKKRRPNFCVIKLRNTDRQFRELHLDFDLGKKGEIPYRGSLERRLHNKDELREDRWVLLGPKMDLVGIEGIKKLFLESFNRKGGQH